MGRQWLGGEHLNKRWETSLGSCPSILYKGEIMIECTCCVMIVKGIVAAIALCVVGYIAVKWLQMMSEL